MEVVTRSEPRTILTKRKGCPLLGLMGCSVRVPGDKGEVGCLRGPIRRPLMEVHWGSIEAVYEGIVAQLIAFDVWPLVVW